MSASLYSVNPTRDRQVASDVARLLSLRAGEVAVIGLAASGASAARFMRDIGFRVYASDRDESERTRAAADALRALGVSVDVGSHDLKRISRAAFVIVSPGVPPEAPPLSAAREVGIPIVSEIEVALRLMPALRTIAVTGTNGKTTTTALVGHLLRALGHDAVDAGNIGVPLCDIAIRESRPTWSALELSSYQLHDTPGLRPTVGVLTTLSADHLDRYPSISDYYADKRRLFANADASSRWVVSADSADIAAMVENIPGQISRFSVKHAADAWYDRGAGQLVVDGEPFIPRADIPLLGDHNVANVLGAVLAVMRAHGAHATAASRGVMASAVAAFAALPHRLEPVAERDGVLWVNDSKATNVDSTLVAIQGMTRPTILLLGGRHKGEPYTSLAAPIAQHCKAVLCFGEAGEQAARELQLALGSSSGLVRWMQAADFEAVVSAARTLATPGDAVLLSPACSSFDMFRNYTERGLRFGALARGGTVSSSVLEDFGVPTRGAREHVSTTATPGFVSAGAPAWKRARS